MSTKKHGIIIYGASSAIAVALIKLYKDSSLDHIFLITRDVDKLKLTLSCDEDEKLIYLETNYTIESLQNIQQNILSKDVIVDSVYIFNGMLHSQTINPEKSITTLNSLTMQKVFEVNVYTPSNILSTLIPLVKDSKNCYIITLSARVGSIEDNRLGGWHSYRASKSALNMIIKTASIEFSQKCKNTTFIAFQPGTTDSPLSKPFQRNIKPESIFEPIYVAEKLLNIRDHISPQSPALFIDHQYKKIPW